MEQLTLFEQELINAVCLFHARFQEIEANEVEVELAYDDDNGYSAEAYVNGEATYYNAVNFITAIRLYIDNQLGKDSISARVELDIDDEHGMIAHISW